MNNRHLAVALCTVAIVATAVAIAKDRQRVSWSEPLKGEKFAEVQLELSLAETSIMAGEGTDLVSFEGSYDSGHGEPRMSIERENERAFIHIESPEKKFGRDTDKAESDDYIVKLSSEPELALRLELGLGDNTINLSNLRIRRLELDAGLADTDVTLDKANLVEAERIEISSGLGSLTTDHLGYLKFKRLTVDAGMGDVKLDLRGYEGQGVIDVSVGMGSCDVIISEGVGLRVYHDRGFMSSVDLDGLKEIKSGVWETPGYASADNRLEMDVSVGMGSLDLQWR